jgi:hypothetical protein
MLGASHLVFSFLRGVRFEVRTAGKVLLAHASIAPEFKDATCVTVSIRLTFDTGIVHVVVENRTEGLWGSEQGWRRGTVAFGMRTGSDGDRVKMFGIIAL